MRILYVFTGGTIGSTADNGIISTDTDKPDALLKAYRLNYGEPPFEYDSLTPVTMLSENSTGGSISVILNAISYKLGSYDGVIVFHGTDTLQYTAAALGYYFGNDCVPICVVSSNHPVEDSRANGLHNLKAATDFILGRCGRGVFVMYANRDRNSRDGKLYPEVTVHRATRLLAHGTYEDSLSSLYDIPYGRYISGGPGFERRADYFEKADMIRPLSEEGSLSLDDTCGFIMRIIPFPGMVYPHVPEGVKAIVHETFHSGTINTAYPGYIAFFEEMKKRGINVFLTGCASEGNSVYLSTSEFVHLGVTSIPGIAPVALYMKLWMYFAASRNAAPDDAADMACRSLGGDIV